MIRSQWASVVLLVSIGSSMTRANEIPDWPTVLAEDFEKGDDRWRPFDPEQWKIQATDKGNVYSQFVKASKFKPPHRSPFNIAIQKELIVSDFVLDARVRSTIPDYNHRDACVVFGYQDAAHYYYVHLGKKADDHANQIFIVNDAPRIKISATSTEGTNWTDEWHKVRVVRRIQSGSIEIYFDNMDAPVMTATDKTFQWGQIGVGTFDDTSEWDDIVVKGIVVNRPEKK